MAVNSVPQGAEMSQLRQEAIRRAREMQARAHRPVNYTPPEEPPEESPPEPAPEPVPEPSPPPSTPPDNTPHPRVEQMPMHPKQPQRRSEAGALPLNGTLDFLTKDPERAMILLLLLILMEEKADNSLLFAMMYLMS